MPSLAVAWSPPTLTAGDSEALAEALTASPAVEVLLGPGLAGWDARLGPALQALSPRVRVTSVRQAEQAAIVARPDALTVAREPGSGRPRYRAEGIELQETWLRDMTRAPGRSSASTRRRSTWRPGRRCRPRASAAASRRSGRSRRARSRAWPSSRAS
ncbi:hypothetical protein [Nannocystis pusilla]|uniref:hypothetical protein n=1 Tax=Nannocystis pusilla TaxID=889268 RepID=UPI003B80C472